MVRSLRTKSLKRKFTKTKSTNRSCRVRHKAQRVIAFTPVGNQIGPGAVWSESHLLRYRTSIMIKTQVEGVWTCWFKYTNRLWSHRILYLGDFKWQPIETINIKYLYLTRYYHSSYLYVDTKRVNRGKGFGKHVQLMHYATFLLISFLHLDRFMWELWCTDSHYDMLISDFVGCLLSIS